MTNNSITRAISSTNQRGLIILPIEKNIISLRGISPERLRFEIEYGLERGTTANCFLINIGVENEKIKDPAVIIHPPGGNFKGVFIKELLKQIPNREKLIHVVVGHINPNRIEVLHELVNLYPNIKIFCSTPGAKLLESLWDRKKPSKENNKIIEDPKGLPLLPKIQVIKQKERIAIGDTYQLVLIPAPTAKWPGGLLAFEESLGLLMSDKFFGAHICTTDWSESNRISTEEERRHYFDSLMAGITGQVNGLINEIEELDIRCIAPGHGPAIEGSWRSLLNDYRKWGEGQQRASARVVLLFASAYGNTAAIADALANGISKAGVRVESLNCEFTTPKQLIESIRKADGYLIGSPTLGGHAPTPIVSALGSLLAEGDKNKPVGVFGSYGWSGEALEIIESKLRDAGFNFAFNPIKIKFSPDPSMLKELEETGTSYGRSLLKKLKQRKRSAATGLQTIGSDPAILALGRIVGSLSVLTASKQSGEVNLSGAMVASWVSQASFNPPGISIAIAKDRAVADLLHTGDKFTLNILANGREKELMRQFLQPFEPGENRFKNLEIEYTPNGQPILPGALAWVEGLVKHKMECGDHWVLYSQLTFGKVLDGNGVTAIHHRRSGANY